MNVPKSSPCLYQGRICRWHGESPLCDRDAHTIGFMTPQHELMASTRYDSISSLCSDAAEGNNPGADCCAQYGQGCLFGYKRLWCHVEPVVKTDKKEPVPMALGGGELCEWEGRQCQWYGTSPLCLATEYEIGNVDDKAREYVVSTREKSLGALCAGVKQMTARHCCKSYGSACVDGYKRLWCFPKAGTSTSGRESHSTRVKHQVFLLTEAKLEPLLSSSKQRKSSPLSSSKPPKSPLPLLPPPDWASHYPCRFRGRTCEWHGSSPFCGRTSTPVGQTHSSSQTLLLTTEHRSITDLCENVHGADYPGESCCRTYYATCWTGYKRLWCSEERPEAYWETDLWRHGKA
ncbi:hypothetical protein CDD81_6829 [Ophiocordyceps australis]|uniref:Uncharacterized protein n=1 Tax=Ophiocordyceps australis TaxID=1399860 RepID=A0A2C5Y4W7_9HYPO|nr:hypothetical protein CDD81_6829 [Ophiocordyceps australis]